MEKKNNGKGIFYGVIGVATLIVAIIGATFAYFTATQSAGQNNITGNAATISFGLAVEKVVKVDEEKGGMIPMTDSMVGAAVANGCLDDNGNAVCQVYKITITNKGTASMFLDGYVNLYGGLEYTADGTKVLTAEDSETNMRWVQVFATGSGEETTYSVTGTQVFAKSEKTEDEASKTISFEGSMIGGTTSEVTSTTFSTSPVTTNTYVFNGNPYNYISNNYLRLSTFTEDGWKASGFTRSDTASELIQYQYVEPKPTSGTGTVEDGSVVELYFAVWLTETGENQTPDADTDQAIGFFGGVVEFNSASGGEVSATFGGYTRATAPSA